MGTVERLLRDASWTVAEMSDDYDRSVGFLRFRKPVLGPEETDGYHRLVQVLWAYDIEGADTMPDAHTSDEMGRFENHLCAAVEHDLQAVLTAVLTFDGARQWVFYTRDVPEFGRRLSTMPDFHGNPYPIELTTREDPAWSYLRDVILGPVLPEQ